MKLFNNNSLLKIDSKTKAILKNLNGNHIQRVIILFGPPGAGKGTQSELLSQKFFFYNLDTGRVIQEKFKKAKPGEFVEIDGQKRSIDEEKKRLQDGKLCSTEFTAYLMKKRIKEIYVMGKSLILSGSPRSLSEAEIEIPFLKETFGKENISIIYLNLSPEQTLFRNSNRRVCQLMRHSILYIPENANLKHCPLDGSHLIKREDDNPETIKMRLQEYQERTHPLMEYYKKQGFNIKTINAEQYVENVYEDILEALGPSFKVYEM